MYVPSVVKLTKYSTLGLSVMAMVRIATVFTPDEVIYFNGKQFRHRREHLADMRRRDQQHGRIDRVKAQKGKEKRWMKDVNHNISKRIVEIASKYDNPAIVFERLDGIRYRMHGSKRFNRMMSSWSFRQLAQMVKYKAERGGIEVVFVDPRGTSKTCSKCSHNSRSNRPDQSNFRCVKCGYQTNTDGNAAKNIAAAALRAYQQGLL
jgi:putative transposase